MFSRTVAHCCVCCFSPLRRWRPMRRPPSRTSGAASGGRNPERYRQSDIRGPPDCGQAVRGVTGQAGTRAVAGRRAAAGLAAARHCRSRSAGTRRGGAGGCPRFRPSRRPTPRPRKSTGSSGNSTPTTMRPAWAPRGGSSTRERSPNGLSGVAAAQRAVGRSQPPADSLQRLDGLASGAAGVVAGRCRDEQWPAVSAEQLAGWITIWPRRSGRQIRHGSDGGADRRTGTPRPAGPRPRGAAGARGSNSGCEAT